MTTITKKHRLKTILPLAAVAMFASASVSNAAPVVYNLTVTAPADFGGTITLDLDVPPTSTDGTTDTYEVDNAAIVDFSISRPGTAVLFTPTTVEDAGFLVFTLEMATVDDSPVSLSLDMDSTAGGGFIFGGIDFGTGDGHIESGNHTVEGAALTVATTTPAADPKIADVRHLGTTVELDLEGLDSAKTYKLFRDIVLPLSGSKMQIGGDITGMTDTTETDSGPLPVDAFYQVKQQP